MHTVKLLLFGCAFFAWGELFSQGKVNVDSLTTVLELYPKEDTVRVKMLIDIALAYTKGNTDTAIAYAEKSVALADRLKAPYYLARAYFVLGGAFEAKGLHTEAITQYNKALPIFEGLDKHVDIAKVYHRLGAIALAKHEGRSAQEHLQKGISILEKIGEKKLLPDLKSDLASSYIFLGEYQKAIDALDNSIRLYESMNDKAAVARILGNKAGPHYYLAEYAKSIDCLQKALAINEQLGNQRASLFNYNGLASVFLEIKEYEKARDFAKKGLDINKNIKNKRLEAGLCTSLGLAYFKLSDLENALVYFEKSNEILKQTNSQGELAKNLIELSHIYMQKSQYARAYENNLMALKISTQLGNSEFIGETQRTLGSYLLDMPDSALVNVNLDPNERLPLSLDYLQKALKISQSLGIKYSEVETLKYISKNYEMQGDYTKAYESYKKYVAIKDSISGDDVKKQITRKEIQYEFDKKETELKYQQQLTADQLEKQRLLTVQQEQALALNRQTLALKEQALTLSNKEKDLEHLAYLKEQAEKQEKAQELSLSQEREKGKERDLTLKNLELSAQQKQNIYLIAFATLLLAGLSALLYFYNALKKQKNIIAQQNEINEHTIAILSHDIKAPLMGVKLLLKKLNKDDPFVAQASQSLEDQINSVNGILNNLLRMKKMALVQQNQKTSANVNDAVQNVLLELRTAIQAKGLSVENDLKGDATLPIAPEKLQIIFHNLLSNAVKYSFPNQPIRIFHEGRGIAIQDFGVGLSPEQRSKLMREVTASQVGTQQERGSGLGLFLVGAMLQGEAIRIAFESPEVGGTIVKVL